MFEGPEKFEMPEGAESREDLDFKMEVQRALVSKKFSEEIYSDKSEKNSQIVEWVIQNRKVMSDEITRMKLEDPHFASNWRDLDKRESIIEELEERLGKSATDSGFPEAA